MGKPELSLSLPKALLHYLASPPMNAQRFHRIYARMKRKMPLIGILERALLDLRICFARRGIFFLRNDRELWSIVGAAQGKDAVIIGMGPSFLPTDTERFGGYLTFACNKIFLIKGENSWRPDFYSVSDLLVAKNNEEAIIQYDRTRKFLHPLIAKDCPALSKIPKLRVDHSKSFDQETLEFHDNPISGLISGGGTVLATLIQMAYWAGCRNIYLVGVDFSFQGGVETNSKMKFGDKVLISEGEVNHFHPDYRKPGETWTEPKYEVMSNGFRYSREALKMVGVNLVNASRQTKLDVLPKIPFEEQFGSK